MTRRPIKVAGKPKSHPLFRKGRKKGGFRTPDHPLFYVAPSVTGSDETFEIILTKKADYGKPRFLVKI